MIELNDIPELRTRTALNRLVAAKCSGSLEEFLAGLNTLSDRLIRTDLKKSARLTERTKHLHKLIPAKYRAHLYRIRGRHYHLSGNYRVAFDLYQKARGQFTRIHDSYSRAKVGKALLDVLMYLNRYEKALELGRETLSYFRLRKADIDYAQVATNIGNVYHRLDQNKKARRYYLKALEVFDRIENRYALAVVKFNLGNAETNLNNLSHAERLYREAAALYRKMEMDLAAAQADYSLAYVAFLKGEYSVSMRRFEKAAEEFRKLGDRKCLALSKLDLTEVNLHLNLYSQAITDARAVADDFRRLRLDYEQAKALYLAAAGHFAFGDFASVTVHLTEAQRLFRKEKNTVWQLACQLLAARIQLQEGKYDRAETALRRIANTYRRLGESRRWDDVRLLLFESAALSGRYRSAASRQRALEKSLDKMAGYQRFLFYMISGNLQTDRGTREKARKSYQQAIECIRQMRVAIVPDELQRYFWIDKLAAFTRLAGLLLQEGEYDTAFAILEEGKAGIQSPGDSVTIDTRQVPAAYVRERSRLRSLLRRAMLPVGSSARDVVSTAAIRKAEQALWRMERLSRTSAGRQGPGRMEIPDTLNAVQRRLGTKDVLISYRGRPECFGAFIIRGDDVSYLTLPFDYDQLRGFLARLYFSIGAAVDQPRRTLLADRILAKITDLAWKPIGERITGAKRIFIVPDGLFNRVPFAALKTESGRYLGETEDLRIHAHVIHVNEGRAKGGPQQSLTVIAATGPDLPFGSREAELVAGHFPNVDRFLGDKATSVRLFEALQKPGGIVHLVSHAAQSYENDLFSPILLRDGPVYPFDLYAREIKSSLVVLSACQTGDTGIFYRGQTLSLAHAFLAVGARATIASYWPISDEVTAVFMDSFYALLKSGKSSDQAIAAAMAGMRAIAPDLRDWAAFYLMHR